MIEPMGPMRGFEAPYREVNLHRAEQLQPFLNAVVMELTALGYCSRDCLGIWLALEEAIVNGLRHGNRSDPTKRVRVRYRIDAEAVLAEVEDEGAGFDPMSVPDPTAAENLDKPSGRGLLLMRHYMSWLCFHGRGNRVTLCKRRSSES
jgi:serine/threonine-protein kinase RsbW